MTNKTRMGTLKAYIQAQGWKWEVGKSIQYGEQIIVFVGSHRASVNFYDKRGRMVVGGSDSPLKEALEAWIKGLSSSSSSSSSLKPESSSLKPESSTRSAPPAGRKGTRLDELKDFIAERGWQWGTGKDISYGEQIVVSDAGVTALVNFWPKRGNMQVQGNKSALKSALEAWVVGAKGEVASSVRVSPHIGMDESGKGDWFGPLVVAAVYVDAQKATALRQIGVRDSKSFKAHEIQRLAGEIERLIPVKWRHVWVIELASYNELYRKHKNINLLLAEAYAQVAQNVWQTTQAQQIVCDQFSKRADRLENAFAANSLPRPTQQYRAESASIAVAAASILASAAFADALKELGQKAALPSGTLPKGSSEKDKLAAAARLIIQMQGVEALGHYAKLHFKPIQKLLQEYAPQAQPSSMRGPPVTIEYENWRVQYDRTGFWRIGFLDGGYLNWWDQSQKGTIYVQGKADAESVRILKPKTDGKSWHGGLEAIECSVARYIPREVKRQVPAVLGVGFRQRKTESGAEFRFTDGVVLSYYRGKDTLLIQGKLSTITRSTLEALPSPFWAGLDTLSDILKELFPDWRLGGSEEMSEMAEDGWSPLGNLLDWRVFWPKSYKERPAANKTAPCQRALMKDWAAILTHHEQKRHLLAQAPTGLGKTLAALVPALAWVAKAPGRRRVYYLVNRLTQHDNPLRELKTVLAPIFETQTGEPLRVVDIVGRRWLCPHADKRHLPPLCDKSRKTADFAQLPEEIASWQEVKAHLDEDRCPYHTLQGLMSQADVVIGDYWWLFSQMAQENRWLRRAGFSPTDTIVIVDEAHNLAARVRDELSVDEATEELIAKIKQTPKLVQDCLMPVIRKVQQVEPEEGISPSALVQLAGGESMISAALMELEADRGDALAEYSKPPERILRLLLQPSESVVIYPMTGMNNEQRLVFRLVDASPYLTNGYARVHASLSLSGTLGAPTDDYRELRYQLPLFGLPREESLTRSYASPFPSEHQRWFFNTETYGTSQEREKHFTRYAEQIVEVGKETPRVTAVFFSSFRFLRQVQQQITDSFEEKLIIPEKEADAKGGDTEFVDLAGYEKQLRLRVKEHGRAYLFAVYKGRLAEGADFGGNLIKTVIGVSIPQEYKSLYHQKLQELFSKQCALVAEELGDELSQKAKEYTWARLSLSLVLQACGRGIRREHDRCAFVLLDRRYEDYNWRRFLESKPFNVPQIGYSVASFHQKSQEPDSGQWDQLLLDACRKGEE